MNRPLMLLIVEDSASDAGLVARHVERIGYDMRSKRVEDAAGLAAALGSGAWDVVLSDYSMPGFCGADALAIVRSFDAEIPFIFVSGTMGEGIAVEAMRAGANDYVLKGDLQRLTPAINRELREVAIRKKKREIESLLILRTRALEATANGVIITDRSGKIQWTNPAFSALTGYAAEEVIGQTPRLLKSGEHQRDFYQNLWQTILADKTWETEIINRRKDGSLFFCATTITPVPSATGEITHFVGILKDISQQKKTEEQIADALDFNRAVLASSPVGILTFAANGQCLSANAAAAQIVGSTIAQLEAQNFLEIASWKAGGVLEAAQRTLAGGRPTEVEAHIVATFGKEAWIIFRFAPFQHEGQPHLLALLSDITETKRATMALERSELRFRSLIEFSSDLITVVDSDGRIRFESPSLERILGYATAEVLGRSAFDFIHPDDCAAIAAALKIASESSTSPISAEHRLRHRDGSWRTMQSVGRQISFDGFPRAVVVNSRDITGQKHLEDQLRQAQKIEAVGQLAGGIAHDFNNILTVINGYSDIVLHTPGIPPAAVDMLKQVYTAGERAAKLTRQLLTFSRKQAASAQVLDLNSSVSDVARMLQRLLGENIRIGLNLQTNLPAVLADSGMMEQLIVNLAVNARDAMPSGGQLGIRTASVTMTATEASQIEGARAGEFVCLAVTDTGTGIAPHVLPHIFEPFFTTKEVGHGTGLGLATIFGIVSLHHGWLNVTTQVGKGTTFTIFLPSEGPLQASPSGSLPREKLIGGHETILLVEDEPVVRGLALVVLEKLGYRVLEAESGEEALEVWERHNDRIELVITDMVMPGLLTGRNLADKLRETRPALKVVFSSGYNLDMAGLGDDAQFLQKPYHPRRLASIVRNCLDQRIPTPATL